MALTHACLCQKRDRKRLKRLRKRARGELRRSTDPRSSFDHPLLLDQYEESLGRSVPTLRCPPRLDLRENLEATLKFLRAVRACSRGLRGKIYVDMRTLQEVSPAGALLLVAEFDRWREIAQHAKLNSVDVEHWNPTVKQRLFEMGFFRVLRAKPPSPADASAEQGVRFLEFQSGRQSEGAAAKRLRESIEALGAPLADSDALYGGLVEAMTNVRQHAYKRTAQVKRWWMSASVDLKARRLVVMFLDHGSGIPRTLPRSGIWEDVRGALSAVPLGSVVKDDARLIDAAVNFQRSQTGQSHRGHGLKDDVKGYIESHRAYGRLRIISRRGQYIYERDAEGSDKSQLNTISDDLVGTFIEWIIQDYSDEPSH